MAHLLETHMKNALRNGILSVSALLAGIVLQGCGTTSSTPVGGFGAPTAPPWPCSPGICRIEVKVVDCVADGGITVDPPFVEVTVARNMRWVIVTPGYEFAPNGVEFSPPHAQFVTQPSPDSAQFRIRNLKTQLGDFYYYINVDGCRRVDPWIRNK